MSTHPPPRRRLGQASSEQERRLHPKPVRLRGPTQYQVAAGMQRLYESLVVRWSDGWDVAVIPGKGQSIAASRVGYPQAWLEEVGYANSFVESCDPTCD